MSKRSFLVIGVLAALMTPLTAWPQAATPAKRPAAANSTAAGVDKLVKMVKAKMPDQSTLSAAKQGNLIGKLSADDLLKLKEAGASDDLLVGLSGDSSAAANGPAPTASAPMKAPAMSVVNYNSDLASAACEIPTGPRKRVIAVQEFDFGTVMTADQSIHNTLPQIGKGLHALAVKRLQEAGKFRVVERSSINTVLAEQDFGAGNRVKQGTQSKIGRIIGADAILMGTITTFGRDDKKQRVGGGGYGGGILGGIKIKNDSAKAVVAIDYRLIDAETSETIATGEARGESKRESKGVDLGVFGGGGGGGGDVDMSSTNFSQTIVGEATIDCMNKLMENLNSKDASIKARNMDVETRIAEIAFPQIYLASGSNDGIAKCDRFVISRIIKEIHDPVTKELLDLQVQKVGDLVVTDVRDKTAIGIFNGSEAPAAGFVARKVSNP